MSKQTKSDVFREGGGAPMGLAGAIARARDELAMLTQLSVDAVTRTERCEEGGWIIVLDLIESIALMGDNDLLTTYELELDATGEVMRVERTGRYRREQGA